MLEKIQKLFLRRISFARKSTPQYMLYGEFGKYPLFINIYTKMISFWSRLILGDENKFSFKIYKYMIRYPENTFKWVSKVKAILENVGRPDLWIYQQQLVNKNTHKLVKKILQYCMY